MNQIQKTLVAIAALQNEVDLLINSGEIPEIKKGIFADPVAKLIQLDNDLEEIQNKPTKKKNLITGEFKIHGGYYDFKENGIFTIEIFNGQKIKFSVINPDVEFADLLKEIYGVQPSDIILNKWFIDLEADTLKFAFAFQTDLEFETPRNEISLITSKKLSFGAFYQNKMYFRLPELTTLPDELWNYPCYGFAIPNTLEGDHFSLLDKIANTIQEGGELADLRALKGSIFEIKIDYYTRILKAKKWESIFTNWGKYILLPSGNYKKY